MHSTMCMGIFYLCNTSCFINLIPYRNPLAVLNHISTHTYIHYSHCLCKTKYIPDYISALLVSYRLPNQYSHLMMMTHPPLFVTLLYITSSDQTSYIHPFVVHNCLLTQHPTTNSYNRARFIQLIFPYAHLCLPLQRLWLCQRRTAKNQ